MMKNAEVIGSGAGYPDDGSTGSISATVNLKKGDAVKIRHDGTLQVYGCLRQYMGVFSTVSLRFWQIDI
jgi:hypothetical protein